MASVDDVFGTGPKQSTRDGFGKAVLELGTLDPRVVILAADLSESLRGPPFMAAHPDRFFQVGVSEQNMIGMAAGMALEGLIPFVLSFATFSPGRNWDQLRVSVCYSNANVKIVGGHAGLLTGKDGATHQALEDIAITRVLPNLRVVVPADFEQARKATLAIAADPHPWYLRLGRDKLPVLSDASTVFELGKAVVHREGAECAIVACGAMVSLALRAAERLQAKGLSVAVINMHSIKPLDVQTLLAFAKTCGCVVSAEEHQISGGLGGAVAEVLAEHAPVPLVRVGMLDSFGESGEPADLFLKYGLSSEAIEQAVFSAIKKKGECKGVFE